MSNKIHRRLFLGGGAGLGAWLSGSADRSEVQAAETGANGCLDRGAPTFGHTMLFMEEYHQATMEMLGRLSGELDQVGELTSRAAAAIKAGGTAWTSMDDGHMPGPEQKADRRGNPGILRNHNGYKPATFDAMQKGDMVFTNQCNRAVQRARDRGVYVVAVTVNYVDNEFRPKGFTNTNEDNLMLKDVSNEILHSHVPYYQGLVHAPQIPEFTLCPSTTTGSGALHWMLTAETANKVWTGSTRSVEKSAEYLRVLTERVDRIRRHQPRIRETAVTMARRIRQRRPLVCAQPGASGIRQRAQRGGLGTHDHKLGGLGSHQGTQCHDHHRHLPGTRPGDATGSGEADRGSLRNRSRSRLHGRGGAARSIDRCRRRRFRQFLSGAGRASLKSRAARNACARPRALWAMSFSR